jgi:large subunit ribosomal protein L19
VPNLIDELEKDYLKSAVPNFRVGDTVRVHVKVIEGERERLQVFEGTVIRRRGGGVNENFTVRRVTADIGVERTFLVHSPFVSDVDLVRRGQVRRSKLYYLRDRIGRAARVKERRS